MKAVVVAVGVLGSQIAVAVPSVADTADDPCGLAVSYLCRSCRSHPIWMVTSI
jgi:hypothetical protein